MFFPADPILNALVLGFTMGAIGLTYVVVLIRINGLRSLSKMTNFDFVMTIALGSLLAGLTQVTEWTDFWQIMAGMMSLFVVQNLSSRLRKTSNRVEDFMQNNPIFLMKNGEIDHAALKETRVAQSDLIAKLREANALDLSKVQAVVLETTGDVSVLHGDDPADELLIENIRDKTGK